MIKGIKWLSLLIVLMYVLTGCREKATENNSSAVVYRNWFISAKVLTAAELQKQLNIPIPVTLKEKFSGDVSRITTIPYFPSQPHSFLLRTLGAEVTRQREEPIFNFAKRVAITLRTHVTIGYSYMVSYGESKVYKCLGSYPVMCEELALAFQEIMRRNGIWANLLGVKYRDNVWDGHTTVEIYDNVLNKWMIVDPTFAGVFKNPNGIPLDAAEIQASPKQATFCPFLPGEGFDDYYIKPLTNLFTFITYGGRLFTQYSKIMESPDTPYRFLIERVRVGTNHVYVARTGTAMTMFTSDLSSNGTTIKGKTVYSLDSGAVVASPASFAYKTITKATFDEQNSEQYLTIVSDAGGGLKLSPKFVPGRVYLVNVSLRTLQGGGQKVNFSYQDAICRQGYSVEGNVGWLNLSYLIMPETLYGTIFIYHDYPIRFSVRSLDVVDVTP